MAPPLLSEVLLFFLAFLSLVFLASAASWWADSWPSLLVFLRSLRFLAAFLACAAPSLWGPSPAAATPALLPEEAPAPTIRPMAEAAAPGLLG